MKNMKNAKPGELPKREDQSTGPPKVPVAGVGHDQPEHIPHQPEVSDPKVAGEKTKRPGGHNKTAGQ